MQRARRVAVSLLSLGLLTAGPGVAAAQPVDDPVAQWRQGLQAAESHLAASRWEDAETAVDAVLPEMIGSIQPDGDGPAFLALGLFLKAAAEAGGGDEEDALWHWWMAQSLDPGMRQLELPAFGPAAALLDRHRLRQAGEVPGGMPVASGEQRTEGYVPASPVLTRLPAVPRQHWGAPVRLEVLVDREGRASQPVLLDGGGAPLSHVVRQLAAVQDWRFRPATSGDERFADLVTLEALELPECVWPPAPGTAEAAAAAADEGWQTIQEGVDLLVKGRTSKAARRFHDARGSDHAAMADVLFHLANAYTSYLRNVKRFRMKASEEARLHLAYARAAAAEKLPGTCELRALLEQIEGDGEDLPPMARTLRCHLPQLAGRPLEGVGGRGSGQTGEGVDGPVHVGGDVLVPARVFTPVPGYTDTARKARIQGVVIVQSIVDTQGCVTNAKVLKGLPMGLDHSALDTLKWWVFAPATLRGRNVAVYYNITTSFTLE